MDPNCSADFSIYYPNFPLRASITFQEKYTSGLRIATVIISKLGENLELAGHPLLKIELKNRVFSVTKTDVANSVSIALSEGSFNFYITDGGLYNTEDICEIYGVKDFTLYRPGVTQNIEGIRAERDVNITTGNGSVRNIISDEGDVYITMTSSTRPAFYAMPEPKIMPAPLFDQTLVSFREAKTFNFTGVEAKNANETVGKVIGTVTRCTQCRICNTKVRGVMCGLSNKQNGAEITLGNTKFFVTDGEYQVVSKRQGKYELERTGDHKHLPRKVEDINEPGTAGVSIQSAVNVATGDIHSNGPVNISSIAADTPPELLASINRFRSRNKK